MLPIMKECVPEFTLNADQKHARQEVARFLQDRKARYFGLFGAAGTGKTSTIVQALSHCCEKIAFSAPTHKAAGILAGKAPEWIDCHTIHKLLGCKKHYNKEDGTVEFLPSKSREMIDMYDVVVVDECSMIGETMYAWIDEAAERNNVKVIFLGDRYQLPPVKDGEKSPCFEVARSCELTEIMRHSGVIQTACDSTRKAIIEGTRPALASPAVDEFGEISQYQNSEQGIANFFEYFLEDPNNSKALAFKNSDVDFMNDYVRRMLYGDKADEPYLLDERVVLGETYESPTSGGIYHTGTECNIQEIDTGRRLGLACYRLYFVTDYGVGFEGFAFGTKAQKRAYFDKLDILKRDGKAGRGWRPYFELKETFCRVRPGYATTCHKSQGSTYSRVFLLQSELVGLWDKELLARLLYVAYSRASKEIVLL